MGSDLAMSAGAGAAGGAAIGGPVGGVIGGVIGAAESIIAGRRGRRAQARARQAQFLQDRAEYTARQQQRARDVGAAEHNSAIEESRLEANLIDRGLIQGRPQAVDVGDEVTRRMTDTPYKFAGGAIAGEEPAGGQGNLVDSIRALRGETLRNQQAATTPLENQVSPRVYAGQAPSQALSFTGVSTPAQGFLDQLHRQRDLGEQNMQANINSDTQAMDFSQQMREIADAAKAPPWRNFAMDAGINAAQTAGGYAAGAGAIGLFGENKPETFVDTLKKVKARQDEYSIGGR